MIKTKRVYEVYSDGSGNSLDSDGGWGYVITLNGVKIKDKGGFLAVATNNIAELTAAIQGLEELNRMLKSDNILVTDCIITLISDSQLVLNYAKNTWKCKKEHLRPLNHKVQFWHNKLKIKTQWVKGHSGNEHNETCDVLAGSHRKAGRKNKSIIGLLKTLIRIGIVVNPKELDKIYRGLHTTP